MKFLENVAEEDKNNVMTAIAYLSVGAPVGRQMYDMINEMVDKYPDVFTRETAWRKIPESVHQEYNSEYLKLFPPTPFPKLPDGSEPMGLIQVSQAMWHEAEQRAEQRKNEPKPTFQSLYESMCKQAEKEAKDREIRKTLWDKHYKKYGVSFRPENNF